MQWMSRQVKCGRYLDCPNGSHLSQYDDPGQFFPGLVQFFCPMSIPTVSEHWFFGLVRVGWRATNH